MKTRTHVTIGLAAGVLAGFVILWATRPPAPPLPPPPPPPIIAETKRAYEEALAKEARLEANRARHEANRERLDILGAAARLDRPWLVVHGTGDDTVDPADGRQLAATGPRATAHWVEDAGHTFQARHPFGAPPRELNDALQATLAHFDGTLQS